MRIRQNTPDRLIIEDRPWLLGAVLIVFILAFVAAAFAAASEGKAVAALAFLAIALGAGLVFAFFVERVWLILDRPAGTIELRRRNLRRFRSDSHALRDLEYALVQTSHDSDGDTHRLALKLRGRMQPIAMTTYYSGGRDRPASMADAIDSWIAAPGPAPGPRPGATLDSARQRA